MSEPIVPLDKLTRKEFREALKRGEFQMAIVPTGSTEQHDEHLAMIHDTASAECIAVRAASREKGETLLRAEVQGVVALLREMIGRDRANS